MKVLHEVGWKVVVAAGGRPYEFYRNEYPAQELIKFPGIEIKYPGKKGMALAMALNIPRFLRGFRKEHEYLKKLVNKTGASLVISDNRYGCWHPYVNSVFMTHQLNIMLPSSMKFASVLLKKINFSFIRKYDECWIPDSGDEDGISGLLSHCLKLPPNSHYIGSLSRLYASIPEPASLPCPAAEIFVLLSGPEPQRSILETIIIGQLRKTFHTAIIAGGRTESDDSRVIDGHIRLFASLGSEQVKYYAQKAEYIICRSGYSTLMDLAALGKTAILIPTPGQTEQEYLAVRLSKMNVHYSVAQEAFQLSDALLKSKGYKGLLLQNDYKVLNQRLKSLYDQAVALRAL